MTTRTDAGQPDRMRIAVVHSYYSSRQPSGENVVVDLQRQALADACHEVRLFVRYTDELEQSRSYPVMSGLRAMTGRGADPLDELEAFAPDVVHVHNLFPNYGRRWVERISDRLVATMHNYRPICPRATVFRDGAPCTVCPETHTVRRAIRLGCFKDSRAQTIPVALGTRFENDPVLASARRIVTLNDDMATTYAATGVDTERLVTVPNFVPPHTGPAEHDGDFWLYVGRLSHEKGIVELVRDWPAGARLVVVGAGPVDDEVRRIAGPDVELRGQLPADEVRTLMGRARGLFFPSRWPEGLPTVYLEALAAGLPVVARPESIVGTLVTEQGTGFVASDSVTDDLARADSEFAALVGHCRDVYDQNYTPRAWVRTIESVYRAALNDPVHSA